MGGIEVAYQLKDPTDHILFSPTETLANGMPYSVVMQHLFSNPTDLTAVAKEYYNFYNSQTSLKYATVSLVKTSELENLASVAKEIFDTGRDKISSINIRGIQRYYRGNKHWFYDLEDFLNMPSITSWATLTVRYLFSTTKASIIRCCSNLI